jgi:tetratricopeptide (TPR) repeat protein
MMYFRFLTSLLLFCLLLSGVCLAAEAPLSAREYTVLKMAYDNLQNENFEGCLKTLSPLLGKKHPPSHALYYAALACGGLNRLRQAIVFLERGTGLYPEKRNFWHNLGVYQIQADDFSGAVKTYQNLIDMENTIGTPSYYYHLSFALYRLEQYAEALEVISKITKGQAVKKHHLLLQLHCQIALEKWKDCEAVAQRLIQLDPTGTQNWDLLAMIVINRKDYDRACAALEIKNILEKKPGTIQTIEHLYRLQSAWNELARLQEKENSYICAQNLFRAGQYEKALSVLDKDTSQHMEKSYLRGRILFALDRNREAVDSLLKIQNQEHHFLKQDPKKNKTMGLKDKRRKKDGLQAKALLLAGQIHWIDRNWVGARDMFKKLELLPGQEKLGKNLVACMQFYLDETAAELILPELFDPPLVMMTLDHI